MEKILQARHPVLSGTLSKALGTLQLSLLTTRKLSNWRLIAYFESYFFQGCILFMLVGNLFSPALLSCCRTPEQKPIVGDHSKYPVWTVVAVSNDSTLLWLLSRTEGREERVGRAVLWIMR